MTSPNVCLRKPRIWEKDQNEMSKWQIKTFIEKNQHTIINNKERDEIYPQEKYASDGKLVLIANEIQTIVEVMCCFKRVRNTKIEKDKH